MTERNLLIDPCWSAKDLGEPLPSRPHAVSVALPRWEDVIAYEEKVPACINSLKAIYPRFGFNPFVAEIARKSLEFHGESNKSSWPYPNRASALSAQEYCLRKNSDCFSKIEDFLGVSCLIIDPENTSSAKAFWQHTGLGLSSREAAIALGKEKKPLTSDGDCAREELIKRIANIYNCDNSLIRLHRSGMAALTTIISAINCIKGTSSTLQIGFPYVDVLKLPQIIFQGSDLIIKTKLNHIKEELDKKNPAALIIEIPSNPLLQCVDLISISKLAKEKNIPVIVDDTIGSSLNVHLTPYADVIFSSLTKSFAGRGELSGTRAYPASIYSFSDDVTGSRKVIDDFFMGRRCRQTRCTVNARPPVLGLAHCAPHEARCGARLPRRHGAGRRGAVPRCGICGR